MKNGTARSRAPRPTATETAETGTARRIRSFFIAGPSWSGRATGVSSRPATFESDDAASNAGVGTGVGVGRGVAVGRGAGVRGGVAVGATVGARTTAAGDGASAS